MIAVSELKKMKKGTLQPIQSTYENHIGFEQLRYKYNMEAEHVRVTECFL